MELFQNNCKPLKIRIKANDELDENGNIIKEGTEHIIICKMMTPRILKKIEDFEKNKKKSYETINEMLELFFDKPAEFWGDYPIEYLNDLILGVSSMTREIMLKKNSAMKTESNITSSSK